MQRLLRESTHSQRGESNVKMHPITAVFVSALFCAALATLVVAQQAVSTAL